ncbi:hypothetical protein GCM10027449_16940 [Sinomonas notoginsengisoli]|uniref:hypothetical protein n=1 Tax=Sinomonas notoginsengisoli TaxID=1457311 RepID=UPI001F3FD4CC|nr:hypothetical protein [Sinomonas notoginsengisoli]
MRTYSAARHAAHRAVITASLPAGHRLRRPDEARRHWSPVEAATAVALVSALALLWASLLAGAERGSSSDSGAGAVPWRPAASAGLLSQSRRAVPVFPPRPAPALATNLAAPFAVPHFIRLPSRLW